jgi:hypothetical protein
MQASVNGYTVNEFTASEEIQSTLSVGGDCNYSGNESNLSPQARLSVGVPRSIYKKLKLLAHDREMTISALLVQLIKAEIQSVDDLDL